MAITVFIEESLIVILNQAVQFATFFVQLHVFKTNSGALRINMQLARGKGLIPCPGHHFGKLRPFDKGLPFFVREHVQSMVAHPGHQDASSRNAYRSFAKCPLEVHAFPGDYINLRRHHHRMPIASQPIGAQMIAADQ